MATMHPLKRLLHEPLLHFLVLGALLFVLYAWLDRDSLPGGGEIVVDRPRVEALAGEFQRTWQRPPSREELKGLVDAWVRDEMMYREGIAAGLERDDDVVRRRVVQKMGFLNEGMAADVPTEAELQRWLDAHADRYLLAPRYSLRQVYFDRDRHGDQLAHDMAVVQAALQRDSNTRAGDTSMLPPELVDTSADEIARTFGVTFADALVAMPDGRWAGPVESSFGLHIVRIDARTPGRAPTLAQVRREVERDLLRARNGQADDAFHAALRKRYTVRIDADLDDDAIVGRSQTGASMAAGAR